MSLRVRYCHRLRDACLQGIQEREGKKNNHHFSEGSGRAGLRPGLNHPIFVGANELTPPLGPVDFFPSVLVCENQRLIPI